MKTNEKRMKKNVSPFFLLIFATLLVRGGVLFSSLNSLNDDPDDYRRLAENWYSFGVFGTGETATAFRPPLYPWTLKELVPLWAPSERPPKNASTGVADSTGSADFATSAPSANSGDSAAPSASKDKTEKADKTGKTFKNNKAFNNAKNNDVGPFRRFFDAKIALSRNASIALWHWILGVATVAVVYRIGRQFGFGEKGAAFAAFLVAVDPILLQQSRLVMTETLATFLAATLVWGTLVVRERRRKKIGALFLGAAFGLATLCRPAFFAFAGLVFLDFCALEFFDALRTPKSERRTFVLNSCGRGAAFFLGLFAVVFPWVARNEREFGRPIWTTTHGGYTLYLANNPEIYAHYQIAPFGSIWNPDEFHRRRAVDYEAAANAKCIERNSKEDELFQNDWTRAQANAEIRQNPATFLLATGNRIGELWRVLPNDVDSTRRKTARPARRQNRDASFDVSPNRNAARRSIAVFYSLEFAFAALGCAALYVAARRRRRQNAARPANVRSNVRLGAFGESSWGESPWVVGFLLVASVQLPHLIYWTNMRMRAPLEIFLPILAFFGFQALFAATRRPFVRRKNVAATLVATEKDIKTDDLSA